MAGVEDAVAAKKKPQSKRPSGGRPKDSETGGNKGERRSSGEGERRSSGEHKPRRDSGGRSRERSGSENEDEGLPGRRTATAGPERTSSRSPSRKPQSSTSSSKNGTSSDYNNRYRNRSKSPNKQVASAMKSKPTRMGSGVTNNAYSLDKKLGSAAGDKKPRDVEEQSMGDFAKYQGKLGAGLLGTLDANQNSFVPEESLGSFTGYIKKYEQEELLGLHDKPGAYNPYEQQLKKPKQQLQKPNADASMGDMMNPMKQYGGPAARQAPAATEDSLGSFTEFAAKYETDKLLGLQDSELSAPPIPIQKDEPDIPEESMDVLELLGGEEEEKPPAKKEKKPRKNSYYEQEIDIDLADADINLDEIVGSYSDDGVEEDAGEVEEDEPMIKLPPSRIEKLKKDGSVRYQIMVDTPGGHSPEPMNIVVAIEFEEDSDTESENENKKEDPYEVAARLSHQDLYEEKQGSNYFDQADIDSEDDQSEEEENKKSSFLPGHMSRLSQHSALSTNSTSASDRHTNHSTSTHSTMSSLTISSHIQIQSDPSPSNQNAIQRQPARPSHVAPHNLGTRRGLLLRQMSEASMKSSISSASSYVDPSTLPEDSPASFMQLNLLDMNQTQMQSNEEVEKAILPEALPSGMEHIPEGEEEDGPNAIPAGKEPQIASQELLGMKTMLKHIKRKTPRRSRSFDFDRETPKAMWNSLFARSQKNELPGSQFVDNDDSTEHNEDHAEENAKNEPSSGESQRPEAEAELKDNHQAKKAGFLSTIKKVASMPKDKDDREKSGSKGKSSLWTSMAFKAKVRPKEKNEDQEAGDDDASQERNGAEEEVQQGEEHDSEKEEHNEDEGVKDEYSDDNHSDHSEGKPRRRHRRKAGDKREGSTRSAGRSALKEHRPQRRTGPARNRAKDSTNIHNQSLSGALDFYTADQEGSEEGEEINEVTEPLEPVQENVDGQPKRKARPRRKPPTRTKSDIGGPATTRKLPSRTRSTDGVRGMPNRTRSTPADSSPTRPPRTSRLDEKNASAKPKPKPMPRRTRSTPEGKERSRTHEKGTAVKQRVDEAKPLKLNKPPVNPHGAEVSGHSRALQLPEDATEEQLRDLLDYH